MNIILVLMEKLYERGRYCSVIRLWISLLSSGVDPLGLKLPCLLSTLSKEMEMWGEILALLN